MAVRNPDFYAANATRAYPLDDRATAVDDAGRWLPSDLLVDASIRYPFGTFTGVYLSAVAVTVGQVSVLFSDPAGTLLAAVTLTRPVEAGIQVPIAAIAPGVAGWVVFGPGADTPYQGRFTTAAQSQLSAHVAQPYRRAPIIGVSKPDAITTLAGVVTLKAGTDLVIASEIIPIRVHSGDTPLPMPAIVFSLKPAAGRNVYADYAGTCGARPESGTCAGTPLQTINGVGPDCNGDLKIHFMGVATLPVVERGVDGLGHPTLNYRGGQALDVPNGLATACFDPAAIDPNRVASDLCSQASHGSLPHADPLGDCGCFANDTGGVLTLTLTDEFGSGPMPPLGTPNATLGVWRLAKPDVKPTWKCAPGSGRTAVASPLIYVLTCQRGVLTLQRSFAYCAQSVEIQEIAVPMPAAGSGSFQVAFHFTDSLPPLRGQTVTITGGPCLAGGSTSLLTGGAGVTIADDFADLPDSPYGVWGSTHGTALGSWSAGVINVPASVLGPAGTARLVKVVAAGTDPSLDPFTPFVPPALTAVGGTKVLVRTHGRAGAAAGYLPGADYYLGIANDAAGAVELWHVDPAHVVTLVASAAFVMPPSGMHWFVVDVAKLAVGGGAIDLIVQVSDPDGTLLGVVTAPAPLFNVMGLYAPASLGDAAVWGVFSQRG